MDIKVACTSSIEGSLFFFIQQISSIALDTERQ